MVSVLDLEQNCRPGRTRWSSLTRATSNSDVYLSIRCQFVRLDGQVHARMHLAVKPVSCLRLRRVRSAPALGRFGAFSAFAGLEGRPGRSSAVSHQTGQGPARSDRAAKPPKKMVGRGGLEPPTSRLSGVRSNHLSYRPIWLSVPFGTNVAHVLVERIGIEPMTPCLQSRCSPS